MLAKVIHIQETDSTNNYLKQLLSEKRLAEGTIVFSCYQTAGKGQQGNTWESDRGENLLFSIVLYPQIIKASEQFIISQAISLGVADFLNVYTDDISIKWPNDIYWRDKKICGILIENALQENLIKESVCGIGININQKEFRSNAPNPVSLTQITGRSYSLESMQNEVHSKIMMRYLQMMGGGISQIRDEYKQCLFHRSGYHLYNNGETDFRARIKDIETNGRLVLEAEDGMLYRFAFKEVRYK
ncbi:BirA family biotin operon repressor/biotin-[acetyl-CoA-carboxylase] ligase [Dysgonomonas hofstadii]|uniref:BirA family biotin operon repressor/biotin-[acetyl-CoA-carboxylase] ligase n=1 Tax=Dysgonomonas hofstadii TaxID=637886 RepID=A0A840CK33_9BACT|nr:biotin--[acetyl-CoA-carboxylase] ligase [Dysgonomonas hofstadii]MBB4035531.1 BirA family biotin operon repressor/biotin-[acetyl-CoA-carboxylase] ligase [Dysgonomonas hofstadii]